MQGGGCIKTAHFCIDKSLVCDGQPNCSMGDNTDELECEDLVMIVSAAVTGTCVVLIIMTGAAVYWLRKQQRRTLSSQDLVSSRTSQTLLHSSQSEFSLNLPNNHHSRTGRKPDISLVEISVPPPPPPPFRPLLSHTKQNHKLSQSSVSLQTALLQPRSPIPPPNSPASLPNSIPVGLRSSDTFKFHHSEPLIKKCSPVSQKLSSLQPTDQCKTIANSQQPVKCQRETLKAKTYTKPPKQNLRFKSFPPSPSSPCPTLSPPPTPPPPPIADPMQSPWLAAIRVPTSQRYRNKTRRFRIVSSSAENSEESPDSETNEEQTLTSSHVSNLKNKSSSDLNRDLSVSKDSKAFNNSKLHRSNSSKIVSKTNPLMNDCNHSDYQQRDCSVKIHCHHCPYGSLRCILHHLQYHRYEIPNDLVRSRSLPRNRTKMCPKLVGASGSYQWHHAPQETKRRKSCLDGWDDEPEDESSLQETDCLSCVSDRSRAIQKSHPSSICRRYSNPLDTPRDYQCNRWCIHQEQENHHNKYCKHLGDFKTPNS
ncbi:hypothetical protein SK128_013759 [Halocaridina rubra]|uniref:Uncharacterized protein n=1 Tax=Halocaridina rubra TaxID=373956 RepID=A0AAN9AAA0_HALRR